MVSSQDQKRGAAECAPGGPPLCNGVFALELIERQTRRLSRLRNDVLADREREPLHQLRVSLRRLRTALLQFAPALALPDGVTVPRLAAVARRTGRCRDLDVLRLRLEEQLLPRLPGPEQNSLKGALRRLGRDRADAFELLRRTLMSRRTLKLQARLQDWQEQPRFTPLGQLPLQDWLVDWQAPFTAGLFLHAGWLELDPNAGALHDLRKRIKAARYALESLQAWCEPPLQAWIGELREAQDHLGELHDLQVLRHSFAAGEELSRSDRMPLLRAELDQLQQYHWRRWRDLALRCQQSERRRRIQRLLLEIGRSAGGSVTRHSHEP